MTYFASKTPSDNRDRDPDSIPILRRQFLLAALTTTATAALIGCDANMHEVNSRALFLSNALRDSAELRNGQIVLLDMRDVKVTLNSPLPVSRSYTPLSEIGLTHEYCAWEYIIDLKDRHGKAMLLLADSNELATLPMAFAVVTRDSGSQTIILNTSPDVLRENGFREAKKAKE